MHTPAFPPPERKKNQPITWTVRAGHSARAPSNPTTSPWHSQGRQGCFPQLPGAEQGQIPGLRALLTPWRFVPGAGGADTGSQPPSAQPGVGVGAYPADPQRYPRASVSSFPECGHLQAGICIRFSHPWIPKAWDSAWHMVGAQPIRAGRIWKVGAYRDNPMIRCTQALARRTRSVVAAAVSITAPVPRQRRPMAAER